MYGASFSAFGSSTTGSTFVSTLGSSTTGSAFGLAAAGFFLAAGFFFSGLCPNSPRISTISVACAPSFCIGSTSGTGVLALAVSPLLSTSSFTPASGTKAILLYPSMMISSPVDTFTLLRGATACNLKVPNPFTLTTLSCLSASVICFCSSDKNSPAFFSLTSARAAITRRSSDQLNFSAIIRFF